MSRAARPCEHRVRSLPVLHMTAVRTTPPSPPVPRGCSGARVHRHGGPAAQPDAPAVTGTVRVGGTLTAGTGAWSVAPASYVYRWKADEKPLAGGTGRTYTLPASVLGEKVSVTVTARRTGHTDAGLTTAAEATMAERMRPVGDRLRQSLSGDDDASSPPVR